LRSLRVLSASCFNHLARHGNHIYHHRGPHFIVNHYRHCGLIWLERKKYARVQNGIWWLRARVWRFVATKHRDWRKKNIPVKPPSNPPKKTTPPKKNIPVKPPTQVIPAPVDPNEIYGKNYFIRENKNGHSRTVVLLHGFTANGQAFRYLSEMFPEHVRVVAPSAPLVEMKDLAKPVRDLAYSWGNRDGNPVHSWTDHGDQEIEQFKRIHKILDKELEILKGNSKKLYIGGHSQGMDMAVRGGVMYPKNLGGIFGLQGSIWGGYPLPINNNNAQGRMMFLMGRNDKILNMWNEKERMRRNQIKPFNNKRFIWRDFHMGHDMNVVLMSEVSRWMLNK